MSILETIIYLSLLSFLLVGATTSFYSMSAFEAAQREAITIESEGMFVTAKIEQLLSEAESVTHVSDRLSMRGAARTTELTLEDGTLVLTEDSDRTPLTSQRVSASAFSVAEEDGVLGVSFALDGRAFHIVYDGS